MAGHQVAGTKYFTSSCRQISKHSRQARRTYCMVLRRTGCNYRPTARGCGGIAGSACIGWRPARPAPPSNDPAGCRAGVHRTLACKCHCSRYLVNRVTLYQNLWFRLQVGVWQGPRGAHGQTTRLMRMPHMLLLGCKFVPVMKITPVERMALAGSWQRGRPNCGPGAQRQQRPAHAGAAPQQAHPAKKAPARHG